MSSIDLLFEAIVEDPRLHAPTSAVYRVLKAFARAQIEALFSSPERVTRDFWQFGRLSLPYTSMGAVTSLDLFGLDELIIFAFYHRNRARYRRALDIGANLGLHSMIMGRCGFEVKAFEPDPWHYDLLKANLAANNVGNVDAMAEAVSTTDGKAEFVRVLGNTTGSHLAGSKSSYGEREHFPVSTAAVGPLLEWADFAKIDAEGHERDLLLTTTTETFAHLDVIVEIGNATNAEAVFTHYRALDVGMFAQKIGWQPARRLSDMPTSHRDGSLFLSTKAEMPW
jgi:FkbM family methyltransferase